MKFATKIRWKLRREFSTFFWRVIYLLCLRPVEPLVNWLYDRFSPRLLSFRKNFQATISERVAVYLLYQPTGVSDVTFGTVALLKKCGFSVFIVSNAKLMRNDIDQLSESADIILERPNYGLDFGGYRDAVLHLKRQQINLSELLLVNDSVICSCGDLQAFISNMQQYSEEAISAVELRGGRGRTPILTSYFLLFRGNFLNNPSFWRFWCSYQMASSHHTTVRRGERGLSAMIAASGVGFRGMIGSDSRLSAFLNAADCTDLKLAVRYCAITDKSLIRDWKNVLSNKENFDEIELKRYIIEFVQTVASRRSVVASFPYLAHVMCKMPIQKKGSTLLQRLAVCRFADAINDGVVVGINQAVVVEITRLRERYLSDQTINATYSEAVEICGLSTLNTEA